MLDKYVDWAAELLPGAPEKRPNEDTIRIALFQTVPVEWNRLPQFQDVTIRLIAQRGIFHGKAPPSAPKRFTLRGAVASKGHDKKRRRPSIGAPIAATSELYLQDEVAHCKVSLPLPLVGHAYHLFCSPSNAGALELAEELMDSDVFITKGKELSAPLSFTTDMDKLKECDHMLILLDERTWTSGVDTATFVEQIHKAMRIGVHLICAHEFPSVVGPPRHACDFSQMFNDDWTPAHLAGGTYNIYREMDLVLKGEEWREPGLVALASKIAASARQHQPIKMVTPETYVPSTAANPWAMPGGAVSEAEAASDWSFKKNGRELHESRMSIGAASAMMAPPPMPASFDALTAPGKGGASEPAPKPMSRMSIGAASAMMAPPPMPAALEGLSGNAIELVSTPRLTPRELSGTTTAAPDLSGGTRAAPDLSGGTRAAPDLTGSAITDISMSNRLQKMFSPRCSALSQPARVSELARI